MTLKLYENPVDGNAIKVITEDASIVWMKNVQSNRHLDEQEDGLSRSGIIHKFPAIILFKVSFELATPVMQRQKINPQISREVRVVRTGSKRRPRVRSKIVRIRRRQAKKKINMLFMSFSLKKENIIFFLCL